MRGKEPDTIITELTDGITPAYAGKRVPRVYGLSVPGDHPRVCGEKMVSMIPHRRSRGSPPRMRGKVHGVVQELCRVGITPAYAGKRTLVGECPKPLWDHPRVCGEKNNTAKTYSNMEGSPPRMRGKGQAGRKVVVELGITPAYAGKSTPDRLFLYHLGDHPRVCGEKGCCRFSSLNHSGSPPRVRGKGFLHFAHKMLEGITPAYAGKSTTAGRGRMPSRDHPRVCGEKGDKVKHCFHDLGSPPRMRGKDGINDSAQAVTGITPACAGKRVRHRRISKPTRDHPRICGEKVRCLSFLGSL